MKWNKQFLNKLNKPGYRHSYVASHVKVWIARKIHQLREDRALSQGQLADRAGKKQSAISRIEDPEYGQLTVKTLLDVAEAFDVALVVDFVDFPSFLKLTHDVSDERLHVQSFDEKAFFERDVTLPEGKFIGISSLTASLVPTSVQSAQISGEGQKAHEASINLTEFFDRHHWQVPGHA